MKLQSFFLRISLLIFAGILSYCFTPRSFAQSNAQPAAAILTPAVPARIAQAIDDTQLARLKGNVHPLARPEFDQGAVPDSTPMNRMLLLLQRSLEQEAALQQLMAEQQVKDSPNFHKWLTPQQFGAQFGPADADIQTLTDWLTRHGFQGIKVAAGKTAIEFSGTVGQVRSAFQTEIHHYLVNSQMRQANSADPQIPAALTPVVAGIVTLHNFPRKSMIHRRAETFSGHKENISKPQFTTTSGCGSGGSSPCYVVGPADFAKIYNLPTTLNGTGVTIALVADSNITPSDVTDFRTLFGLPATCGASTSPCFNVILDGPDPGLNGGDEGEADLDIQTAGMVAPGAIVDLVVSEGTLTTAGIDLSAFYIVDNNIADVVSESFGVCEPALGTTGTQFYSALWEQAAAQGTSVMVSAGDNGPAGCDDFTTQKVANNGLAVSGIASTPFNVAVGGTDFDDAGTQVTGGFWSATNTGMESALGYIHEIPWNDSCAAAATPATLNTVCATANGIAAASGGASVVFAKPSWQSTLTPADSHRDLPDVSLFASDGPTSDSFYLFCEADAIASGSAPSCVPTGGHFSFLGAGGTSASSPAFAGIIALINQQQKGRQGNVNPVLYAIAKAEATTPGFASCNSTTMSITGSTTCVFYDVTKGNNSVPCAVVAGIAEPTCSSQSGSNGVLVTASGSTTPAFTAGAGYDLATGLGTVNVTNLAAAWATAVGAFTGTTTTNTVNGTTTPAAITHGQSVTLSATVAPASGTVTPTGDVSFLGPNPPPATNVNGGVGCAQIFPSSCSQTLTAGTASVTTTFLPGGSYTLKAHYAGDGTFAPSDSAGVPVVVSPEPSKLQMGIVTSDALGNITSNPFATSFPYGSNYILRMDILKNSGTCLPFTTRVITGCAFDATGQVTITDNGSPLDAGTFSINSQGHAEDQPIQLSAGTHNISATYSGDISYTAPAAATALSLTVTQAATSTGVAPSVSSIASGGSITLTASVATNSSGVGPTGMVQFKNGSAAIGSANCVPTAGSSSTFASCTATLSTTLSLLPPLSGPNRIPTLPVPWVLLAVSALLVLLLNLKRVPPRYRGVYACAASLLLAILVTGLAVGCGGGSGGGGGGVHTDSITAVYSGDTNYSGSTSPAVQVTIQ